MVKVFIESVFLEGLPSFVIHHVSPMLATTESKVLYLVFFRRFNKRLILFFSP